jgi:DNA-binding HxlR family transcriptional regulator
MGPCLVSRTMYPVMPARVDYTLTAMGYTLLDAAGVKRGHRGR